MGKSGRRLVKRLPISSLFCLKWKALIRYLLIFLTFPLFSQPSIIFRLDDYVIGLGGMQDSLVDLFVKHQIPLSVGIIPFEGNSNQILHQSLSQRTLRHNGAIEIMMHGFAHLDKSVEGKSKSKVGKSEFAGDSYESQFQRLKLGKSLLDSLFEKEVTVFSPPWNTYDKNTLRALKNLGFSTISSDLAGKSYGITFNFLPFSTEDFGIFEIQNRANLESYSDKDVIVVMFHPYSIGKAGVPDINTFETLLIQLKTEGYQFYTYSSYLQKHSAGRLRLYINSRLKFNPILNKIQPKHYQYIYLNSSRMFWVFYIGTVLIFSLILKQVFKYCKKRFPIRVSRRGP
jgi:peptidoglycan/xylan/chitin deacetylase (PgdA/CDA1 family)